MSRRNILIALVVVLAAAGAYLVYNNANQASASTITLPTTPVTRGDLIATVNSAGPVAARAQVMLNFGQSGNVKQVYVQLGDRVKQGQVLAELEAPDLQMALAQAQASLNEQQASYDKVKAGSTAADLEAAQASVDAAQANYDAEVRKAGVDDAQIAVARAAVDRAAAAMQAAQINYDTAVNNGVTNLADLAAALKQAKDDYQAAQAQYTIDVAAIGDSAVRAAASGVVQAKAALIKLQTTPTAQDLQIAAGQLESAKVAVEQAQSKLRNAQIVAPFDGTISQINIDNFYAVTPASGAMQISDLNTLEVTVNMAEVDIERVKTGQDVMITLDALPDQPQMQATVDQVALTGLITQGVVNYPVVIKLVGADPNVVKTGMTANVAIVVDRHNSVLMIPSRAIRTVNRQRVVTVQTAPGIYKQVAVQVGLANDTQTEITSGLNEGDVVVINTLPASRPASGGGPGVLFRGGG